MAMGKFIEMTGQQFRHLRVVKVADKDRFGRYRWECVCDCGMSCTVGGHALRSGNTGSCGCRKRNVLGESTTTHGLSSSHTYWVFHSMHNRCENSRNKCYHLYGGRGIKVCERWAKPEGFGAFVQDMGLCPNGLMIERIDNNGNYEPGNCKWATVDEQANNKRSVRWITWHNQTHTLTQWARLMGKSPSGLWWRLSRLPLDEAMAWGETVKMEAGA